MPSPPTSVEAYIAERPPAAQAALRHVRDLVLGVAVPGSEAIRYGMPAYRLANGRPVFFAGWKQHLSVHDVPTLDDDLEAELAPYRSGKDTLTFPYRREIPFELIGRTLQAVSER